MNMFTNLFTFKELLIMGIVLGILFILVIFFTILSIVEKKKQEDEEFEALEEDNLDKEDNIQSVEIKTEIKEEPVLVPKKEEKKVEEPLIMEIEEETVETPNVLEMEKAKEELLKVEEELENPKSLEDTITSLEAMEEENAIISYQELLETTKEMNIVATDTGDEFISINELFKKYNEPLVEAEMTNVSIDDAYKGDFTSSPYLSPIEGVETVQNLNEIQLENTANLEKLDKEIRKTNEFLNILKELKKNLD